MFSSEVKVFKNAGISEILSTCGPVRIPERSFVCDVHGNTVDSVKSAASFLRYFMNCLKIPIFK